MGTESRMVVASRSGLGGGGSTPTDDSNLGFALSFMSGRGLLTTRDRRVGPVSIKALAMEIPSISFPFDVSGGAERFKPRRCALRYLALGLDSAGVQAAFSPAALAKNGLSNLKVGIYDGFIEMAGLFRVGEARANFTCRAALLATGPHELQVVFYDTRIWGWLPLPAAMLPVFLRRSLGNLPLGGSRAGAWTFRPGEYFARDVLPRAGWKVPDMQGAHVVGAEVARGQISLTVGRVDEPTAKQIVERSPPAAALRAADGIAAFASAEEKLALGAIREAYVELRDAFDEGRGGPWARERLLQIGASDPEFAIETEQLANDVLMRTPDDLNAQLALAAMAQRDGRNDVAAQHYGRLASMMREHKERFDVIAAELAFGAVSEASQPTEALAAYERAAARAHDFAPVQERVMRLRQTLRNFVGAAEAGERWVACVAGDADKSDAHAQLGQIYLRDNKDFRRARLHFEKSMRLVPDAPAALEGMAETYAARGEPARAAGFLARLAEQAEASHDVARIISLNLRLGEIWRTWLHDPESAAARYRRVLDAAPDAHEARLLLARLAEERGDSAQARQLYEEIISRIEANDQVDLPSAQLVQAHSYLGQLLVGLPGSHALAIENLTRALELDPSSAKAAAALAELLREEHAWDKLIVVLGNLARHSRDPIEVRAAWLEAARLEIEELKNPNAAQTYLETVLDAQPHDAEALALLSPILIGSGASAKLALRLEAAASGCRDAHVRADLLFRLAETQALTGAEVRVRRRTLESTLEASPQHAGAARALVELLRGQGDVMALAAAYDRLAVATGDPTGRAAALLAKARLLATSPGHAASALAAVQEAVAAEAESVEGWLLGTQVLVGSGDLPKARAFLQDALDHFGDKAPLSLHVRLAELARQAGDPKDEIQALRAALDAGTPSEEVAKRFVSLLSEQNRGRESLPWLMKWAEAGTPISAAEAWSLAGNVLTQLGNLDEALATYDKVLALPDADKWAAAEALEKLANRLKRPADVVRALQVQLSCEAANPSPTLLLRLMEAQRSAGSNEDAQQTAKKLLERMPQSLVAHQFLADQFEISGQWQQALDHLLYMVLVCPMDAWDRDARRKVYQRAAALARDIRLSALPALQETFDAQYPELPPSALQQTMEVLLQEEGAWQKLFSLRELQLPQASTEHTMAVQREMATLLHKRLGRPSDALPHYRAVAAANPQDVQTRAALIEIYTKLERWQPLAELQFGLSQVVSDPQLALGYAVASARLYADKLSDTDMARQLIRTVFDRGDLPPEHENLFALLRELDMQAEVAQLLENDLADAPSPDDGRFLELTEVLSSVIGDRARALTWSQRMRDAYPDSDVPRRAEIDLLKADPKLGDITAALQSWADAREGAARAQLLLELSEFAHAHGDTDRSMLALASAAEADGSDFQAVDLLVERHMARGEWTQVLHWLLRSASAAPAGEKRDARLHRALDVALDYANDSSAAIVALTQIDEPTDADKQLLVQLYGETEDWAGLATWKDFASLPPDVLLKGARATGKAGPLNLAEVYIKALLEQDAHVEPAWEVAADAWRRAGKLAELGHWRLAYAEVAPEEHRIWLQLVGHADLFEAGEPVDAESGSIETSLARADLSKIPAAWGVFVAARALGQRAYLSRAALALEEMLDESDPRLVSVLRARVQQELDGGDANVAVGLARQLVVLGDASAADWLESALVMAGQGDELLELLERRAERGGPDAPVLWTRVAGLLAERSSFSQAAEALAKVAAEARTKRWGELQFNVGSEAHDANMQLAGAQVASQFSIDRDERALWLRRAAHAMWWGVGDADSARKLLEQAHGLQPITLEQVKASQATGEEARQELEEALVALEPVGTSPLWRKLARLRPPGPGQAEALGWASEIAGDDVIELSDIAATAEALGMQDVALAVNRALVELQPETFFQVYADTLEKTQCWVAWVDLIDGAGQYNVAPSLDQLAGAATLATTQLQDPERALSLWQRAIAIEAHPGNLRPALLLAEQLGDKAQVTALSERLLDVLPPDSAERQTLLREMLQKHETLGERDKAEDIRRTLVAQGWGTAADKLLLAQGDADMPAEKAAQLFEQVVEEETDPAMRAAALVAAAEAWQRAGDSERAIVPLRKALQEGQDSVEVHRLALQLLPEEETLLSARRIVEEGADAQWSDNERAKLRLRLAKASIAETDFGQAEIWLAQAQAWDTSDAWAILMEMALDGQAKTTALANLWLARRTQGPWEGAERVERLQRAARIFSQDNRADDERNALASLAALRPADAAVGDRLLALHAASGDRAAFVALLETRLQHAPDAEERLALALQAMPLWITHFQDPQAAAAALELCLDEMATPAVLDALKSLYLRQDKVHDFVQMLQRHAEGLDSRAKLTLTLYGAQTAAASDTPDVAYTMYMEVVRIDATHAQALEHCLQHATQESLWPDVLELLERRASRETDPQVLAGTLGKAAAVARDRLHDSRRAQKLLVQALQVMPESEELRERLARLHLDQDAPVAAAQVVAAASAEAPVSLPFALEVLTLLQERHEEAAYHTLMAWIAQRFPEAPQTVSYRLQQARDRGDNAEVLAELLRRLDADTSQTPAERAELQAEAAELAAGLRQSEVAVGLWAEALEGPEPRPQWLMRASQVAKAADDGALSAKLTVAATAHRELIKAAIESTSGAEQASWLHLLTDTYLHTGEDNNAAATLEQLLELSEKQERPLPENAAQLLETLYTRHALWGPLAQLQRRVALGARSAQKQAAAWYACGTLLQDQLGDPQQALSAFRAALDVEPDHAQAQLAAGLIAAERGEFVMALPWLEAQVQVQDRDTPMAHLRALLDCYEHTAATAEGIDLAGAVLARDPDATDVRLLRARLLDASDNAEAAAADWETYLASETEDQAGNAQGHERLASFALQRNDTEKAAVHLRAAIGLVPDNAALKKSLREVTQERGEWQESIALRREEAENETDAEAQAAHYMALAQIYESHLDDVAESVRMLERAAEAIPRDVPLLRRLIAVYRSEEDSAKFLLSAERLLSVSPSSIDAQFLSDLAAAYEPVDATRAHELYARATELAPDSQELKAKHHATALAAGDWAAFAPGEELAITAISDSSEKAKRYVALADVYIQQLGDLDKAVAALVQACAADPADESLWRTLADAYALDPQYYDKAVELYRRLLSAAPLDESTLRILARLSGQMGETDRAYGYYVCLLCLSAEDEEAARFVTACRAARPNLPPRALNDADRAQGLFHPQLAGAAEDLFAPLARFAELVLPGDLAKRGLTERDNLPPEDPMAQTLIPLLKLLSAPVMSLHGWPSGGYRSEVELMQQPALLIGQALLESAQPRQRAFTIARTAELYRTGHTLCERLSGPELQALMAALCMAIDPASRPSGANEETPRWAQLISTPMNQQIRGAMAPRAAAYLKTAGSVDINRWRMAAAATANRVALVFTCDAEEAVVALLRGSSADEIPREQVKVLLQESAEALDLFRFAQSDAYFALRRSLGVALRRAKATAAS